MNHTADIDDVFMFFDKDGSGSISKNDFREALVQLNFGTELRDRELELLTKRFSTHGDSDNSDSHDVTIDYSDFLDHFGSDHNFIKLKALWRTLPVTGSSWCRCPITEV